MLIYEVHSVTYRKVRTPRKPIEVSAQIVEDFVPTTEEIKKELQQELAVFVPWGMVDIYNKFVDDFWKLFIESEAFRLLYLFWKNYYLTHPEIFTVPMTEEFARRVATSKAYSLGLKYMRQAWAKLVRDWMIKTGKVPGTPSLLDALTKYVLENATLIWAQIGLIALAIMIGAYLIINPEKYGWRVEYFDPPMVMMRMQEKIWWADRVGQSFAFGDVYTQCANVSGLIRSKVRIERRDVTGHEWIIVDPTGEPWVEIDWWYDVYWMTAMEVKYKFKGVNLGGYFYAGQQQQELDPSLLMDVHFFKPGSSWCIRIPTRVTEWWDGHRPITK